MGNLMREKLAKKNWAILMRVFNFFLCWMHKYNSNKHKMYVNSVFRLKELKRQAKYGLQKQQEVKRWRERNKNVNHIFYEWPPGRQSAEADRVVVRKNNEECTCNNTKCLSEG